MLLRLCSGQALGHWAIECAVGVFDMFAVQVIPQVFGEVTGPIVKEQPGTEKHIDPIHAGRSAHLLLPAGTVGASDGTLIL